MSRDPDGKTHGCEKCGGCTELHYRRDYDEYWCESCIENENEAAAERQQERDLEDPPETMREQQLRTWQQKQELHRR
jgi:ssDNA-binding Zn-finger/Zn-ribbon topoisomerase 1